MITHGRINDYGVKMLEVKINNVTLNLKKEEKEKDVSITDRFYNLPLEQQLKLAEMFLVAEIESTKRYEDNISLQDLIEKRLYILNKDLAFIQNQYKR